MSETACCWYNLPGEKKANETRAGSLFDGAVSI
jgi:hypothetical protein